MISSMIAYDFLISMREAYKKVNKVAYAQGCASKVMTF